MVTMTTAQEAVASDLSVRYGDARVTPIPRSTSVSITALVDGAPVERKFVGANGEPACWGCGDTKSVERRGVFGGLCESCYDLYLEQRS